MTNEQRAALLALAERCEDARGPDREIDIRICTDALNKSRLDEGFQVAPTFTASVDAALTLVPEGWNDNVSWSAKKQKARAWCEWMPEAPFAPSDWIVHYGRGANRALAICAAALRARASA